MNIGQYYFLFFSAISLTAMPNGLQIANGSASVQMNSNSMAITTDDGAALNWTDFSIQENESVEFIQPHSQSIVINRVAEQNPSKIFGALSSNGKLVLVNPNGIFFGEKSRIDLSSFIASTFDIHAELLKEQKICYTEENRGEIHFSGSIRAKDEVYFFAKNIGLFDDSSITVPGGKVFIGKGGEDAYSHVQSAEKVYLSPGSTINVDALDYGNGGTIVLWGELSNQAYGRLSSRGGMFGGDGGHIEVSSIFGLDYQPISTSTLAPNGKAGTLLLDPINLIIQAAGVDTNITQTPPFTYFPNAIGAILTTGTITGAAGLTGGNVIIRTVGTVGPEPGDIRVNSPIAWATAFSLTLDSANDIFINDNIQHDTAVAGGVFLNAVRNIVVSSALVRTAVGSQNALTSVAAGGDVTVIAVAAGTRSAQIGFFFDTLISAGPITVDCVNLTIQSGGGAVSSAMIGHGRFDSIASFTLSTAAGATIDVNATGNILIRNSGGVNAISGIGHGAMGVAVGSAVNGDISVVAAGNLAMNANFGAGGSACRIGLISQVPSGGIGGTFTGDIDIEIGNQIDLRGSDTAGSAAVHIGHGSFAPGTNAVAMNGDIRICCNGNANLIAGVTGGLRISHFTTVTLPGPPDITGDINFAIGGNLLMQINPSPALLSSCFIGYANAGATPCNINTNMNVSVCGNATLTTPMGQDANNLGIGTRSSTFTPGTSVNIAIGGDFTATNLDCRNFFVGNQAGNFNFGVEGNLTVSMSTAFPGAISGSLATNIFVGGSIIATPNAAGGADSLTIGRAAGLFPFQTATLDVRAGGDITWPSSMIAGTTAYNILAGHTFTTGEIWNGTGAGLISVASQPITFNPPCGLCLEFTTASPAITPLCGSFSVSATTSPVSFTTSGPLTLSSLCTSCTGPLSFLTIGGGGDITFVGVIGALNIGPFNTVILAQDITSSSSISASSCNDLTLLPGNTITSTGLGESIVLISDVDNSGAGNLNIQGDITSNNGQICLLAAPGSFGCNAQNCFSGTAGLLQMANSSVNQTEGTISSGSGPVIIAASGNVLIDGAATSITSTTGGISITSNANLTINEDIVSTSGSITTFSLNDSSVNSALLSTSNEIRMIAGHNLSLTGTANIISTANIVTLISDHQFPAAPLYGTGNFSMSCSSAIASGPGQPVRIFTALQGQNSVCGGATINGFQHSDPLFGFPGTLYEDTAYEIWCTYFNCSYPYPYSGLGLPFTFFYKDCLQQITQQAMVILDELLANLHPYNEFPGWMVNFWLKYENLSLESLFANEPYLIRRRAINFINHPKTHSLN